MKYLLDTNVLSEVVRKTPSRSVVAKLHTNQMRCCTSATVWQELLYGVARLPQGKMKSSLSEYLDSLHEWLTVLPYGQKAADWHAQERARLEKAGHAPSYADGEIAAVAATSDLVLVTANLRDFRRFRGLSVESWWT
ncbi:MAG: type II toxin-antitoxin system VapC family toxin [Polyangiaceae bacterium]|nr:type II toxin-antitoxin system VapC family toxin [Polyangiaceae bacterium]